jgi:hypothetical protein
MIRTIFTLTQISICLASGPKIVAEVDNISDPTTPLQKQDIYPNVAAFSTATPRPTTIVWRWWRITDSVSLKRPTSSAKPPTMTVTSLIQSTVTSLAPSGVQKSVISNQPTAVTTTAVTTEQINASTPSKSQIHRENMERELKLFKGFNILQIILSGFIG